MTLMDRRKFAQAMAGAGLLTALTQGSYAWANNDSLIRLVVPFAPGGGGDVLGRLFAEKMGPILKKTIIVENKPGGSTTIGSGIWPSHRPLDPSGGSSLPLAQRTLDRTHPGSPKAGLPPVSP